jgi:predicted DCC family thiol-disulfide oxidoreductase YuxK
MSAARPPSPAHTPVLLYDGACGLCARSVQLVLRHDRRGILRFAPLQSRFGRTVFARHPGLQPIDSMVWVEPGPNDSERAYIRSDAALHVARYLGGPWRLALAAQLIPRRLRDAAYDWIARHRHRLTGARDHCAIPAPEQRERFLDDGE